MERRRERITLSANSQHSFVNRYILSLLQAVLIPCWEGSATRVLRLHSLLFAAVSGARWSFFMSCCMVSIHLFLWRPQLLRPQMSAFGIHFMHPSSLLLCTCPYQHSLDSLILSVIQATPILLPNRYIISGHFEFNFVFQIDAKINSWHLQLILSLYLS